MRDLKEKTSIIIRGAMSMMAIQLRVSRWGSDKGRRIANIKWIIEFPSVAIYGEVVWDKTENGLRQARSRTGCVMWIWLSSEEREPNRIQRLRCSKIRYIVGCVEGILKIENHGVTYEEALQRCHCDNDRRGIQSDAEDKGGLHKRIFFQTMIGILNGVCYNDNNDG